MDKETRKKRLNLYVEKKRGMKWYCFSIFFRIPLGILDSIVNLLFLFQSKNEYTISTAFILSISIVITIIAEINLINQNKVGFYTIQISLILSILIDVICFVYNTDDYSSIGNMIVCILEFIYYHKRKDFFLVEFSSENDIISDSTVENKFLEYKDDKKTEKQKIVYCKQCGSPLDENKKCTGCGKQYFRIPKIKTTTAIVSVFIITVCLLGFGCLYLTQKNIMLNEEIETINEKYSIAEKNYKNQLKEKDKLQSKYDELREQYDSVRATSEAVRVNAFNYKETAEYWDVYGAITVDSDTRYYHTYTCSNIQDSENYYVSTKWDAEDMGYKPCPDCH